MGIQMCDKDVLERFSRSVGGGPIYYRKPRTYSKEIIKSRKEQWAWRITGFEKVQAVVSYLWKWLSPRRKTRAKEVLTIAKTGRVHGGVPKGYKMPKTFNQLHGDVRKFWRGCKCEECREANRAYCKALKATPKFVSN